MNDYQLNDIYERINNLEFDFTENNNLQNDFELN